MPIMKAVRSRAISSNPSFPTLRAWEPLLNRTWRLGISTATEAGTSSRPPRTVCHFGLYDDGKGNFNEVDVFKEPGSWGYATAGDVDGDGDEDLAAIDQGGLTLLANDGKGGFAAPSVFIRAPFRLRPPLLVDMNGDGAVDLVIPPAAVLLNDSVPSRRIDFDANGVPDECEGLGHQVVGDAKQDGLLNLSDAIWLLRLLFAGAGTPLPCSGVA